MPGLEVDLSQTAADDRPRSRAGFRLAGMLFVGQCLLLALGLAASGRLRVELVPDSASYLTFPLQSVHEALINNRTYGYPLFVQGIAVTLGQPLIPLIQFAVHVIAVFVFWLGFRQWCSSELPAFLAASSLLYANIFVRYVGTVGPDALAASMGILTVGLVLALIRQPGRTGLWFAIGAAIFATCQVRPAYLFLVLLPAIVAGYGVLLNPGTPRNSRRRLTVGLLSVGIVPLLLFCLLRWSLVGAFGLVSFGGYNFVGLVGQFLEPGMVAALPADVVPLAEELLKRREEYAAAHPGFSTDVTQSYHAIESWWDESTWEIAVPAAREVYQGDLLAMNAGLSRLGISIVAARPRTYAVWLAKAFFRSVYMMASETVINPVCLAILLATIGTHLVWAVFRVRCGGASKPGELKDVSAGACLLFIATVYAGGSLLIVIVSSPAIARFMDAAGVFWPAVLAVMLADRIEAVRRLRHASNSANQPTV